MDKYYSDDDEGSTLESQTVSPNPSTWKPASRMPKDVATETLMKARKQAR